MRRIESLEDDLLRRFPQLPRLPRYGYSVLAGLGVFSVVLMMMLCMGLALLTSFQSPATATPIPPTDAPVSAETCADPLAPDAQWQLVGANCVLHEEQVAGASTSILDMSYPYDLIAQYPFTKPNILNVLNPIRDGFWQNKAENPGEPDAITSNWSMEMDTETTAFSANVFSMVFRISAYTGGAHPYHEIQTLTFDFANQTTLALTDIFQDGIDPYALIAPQTRVQILTAMPDMADFINTGTAPTTENYRSWGLTSDSLLIYFDQGQVGPSAAGTQMVSIPLASLATSLKPEYIPG